MSFYDKGKKVRLRLCLDQKERFPEKLFDVANDNFLVKWGETGESVTVVDAETFEDNVMKCYPGFLQIASFNNFRRLFREYGFEWKQHEDKTLEFSHDFFVRHQPQLLEEIVTRRKSFSRPIRPKTPQTSTPLGKRRSSLRRIVLETQTRNTHSFEDRESPRSLSPVESPRNDVHATQQCSSQKHFSGSTCELATDAPRRPRKLDPALLDTFARNELTEDEILSLLRRRDWILSRLEGPDEETYVPRSGTEWMYMFSDVDENPFMWPVNDCYSSRYYKFPERMPRPCSTDPMHMASTAPSAIPSDFTQLSPVIKPHTSACCQCKCHSE